MLYRALGLLLYLELHAELIIVRQLLIAFKHLFSHDIKPGKFTTFGRLSATWLVGFNGSLLGNINGIDGSMLEYGVSSIDLVDTSAGSLNGSDVGIASIDPSGVATDGGIDGKFEADADIDPDTLGETDGEIEFAVEDEAEEEAEAEEEVEADWEAEGEFDVEGEARVDVDAEEVAVGDVDGVGVGSAALITA